MKYIMCFESFQEPIHKIVYHATQTEFDIFNHTNDLGFHFGTINQALDRMKQLKIKNFYLIEAEIYIQNPLKTIDKKTWFGTNLLDILSVNKFVNRKEELYLLDNLKKKYKYDENGKIIPFWSEKALNEWYEHLKDILYSKCDGIVYSNKFEDKKSNDDSYIVFNPEQIKILKREKKQL